MKKDFKQNPKYQQQQHKQESVGEAIIATIVFIGIMVLMLFA